jgi:hypothetical protein
MFLYNIIFLCCLCALPHRFAARAFDPIFKASTISPDVIAFASAIKQVKKSEEFPFLPRCVGLDTVQLRQLLH